MSSGPLTYLDRRTIAHLSNPRNLPDLHHALRIDPHTREPNEAGLELHLEVLAKRGLVVALPATNDFAKLISNLPAAAVEVHDDTARAYVDILHHPQSVWRRTGRHYLLTQEGLDQLQDQSEAPPPKTPSEIQQAVDEEWARTLADLDEKQLGPGSDVSLAAQLLISEFQRWVALVSDACEQTWGVRPRVPIAGGAGWSDLYSRLIVDHENQKTALPALVAPWYMALLTTVPTDATAYASLVEANYTGYVRKSVAAADMAAASGAPATASNVNAIAFAACTGGTSTLVAFANVADSTGSATTAGFRKWGTCANYTISTSQTPANLAIGAYTTTAD